MEITNNSSRVQSQNSNITLEQSFLGVSAINQDLMLLDYGNVLIRKDYKTLTTVKLLSGGCTGKELDYVEFVGRGMLTAAVLGDNEVESPCSRLILRTIRELTHGNNHGVIILSQNNPDLFNFGLAVNRALTDCLRAKILPIIMKEPITERNSAEMLLIVKVAGAMSELQCSFDEIYEYLQEIIKNTKTMPLNVPLNNCDNIKRPKSCSNISHLVENVINSDDLPESSEIVVLLNVHKTVKKIEKFYLIKRIIDRFDRLKIKIKRFYHGHFLSSRTKGSVTITITKLFDSTTILNYFDFPTNASIWRDVNQFLPELSTNNSSLSTLTKRGKLEIPLKGLKLNEEGVNILQTCLGFVCNALISCDRQLNLIDGEKSNGNLGSRFKRACENVQKRLDKQKLVKNYPYTLLRSLGVIVESGLGGTLGSIYGILLESASETFVVVEGNDAITSRLWLGALSRALVGLEQYCDESSRVRTMYEPLKSCESVILAKLSENCDFVTSFGFGVANAERVAQRSKLDYEKYPDSGAHAVGIWLRATLEGVKLFYPGLQ